MQTFSPLASQNELPGNCSRAARVLAQNPRLIRHGLSKTPHKPRLIANLHSNAITKGNATLWTNARPKGCFPRFLLPAKLALRPALGPKAMPLKTLELSEATAPKMRLPTVSGRLQLLSVLKNLG